MLLLLAYVMLVLTDASIVISLHSVHVIYFTSECVYTTAYSTLIIIITVSVDKIH